MTPEIAIISPATSNGSIKINNGGKVLCKDVNFDDGDTSVYNYNGVEPQNGEEIGIIVDPGSEYNKIFRYKSQNTFNRVRILDLVPANNFKLDYRLHIAIKFQVASMDTYVEGKSYSFRVAMANSKNATPGSTDLPYYADHDVTVAKIGEWITTEFVFTITQEMIDNGASTLFFFFDRLGQVRSATAPKFTTIYVDDVNVSRYMGYPLYFLQNFANDDATVYNQNGVEVQHGEQLGIIQDPTSAAQQNILRYKSQTLWSRIRLLNMFPFVKAGNDYKITFRCNIAEIENYNLDKEYSFTVFVADKGVLTVGGPEGPVYVETIMKVKAIGQWVEYSIVFTYTQNMIENTADAIFFKFDNVGQVRTGDAGGPKYTTIYLADVKASIINAPMLPEQIRYANISHPERIVKEENYNFIKGFRLSGDNFTSTPLTGAYALWSDEGFNGVAGSVVSPSSRALIYLDYEGEGNVDFWVLFDPATPSVTGRVSATIRKSTGGTSSRDFGSAYGQWVHVSFPSYPDRINPVSIVCYGGGAYSGNVGAMVLAISPYPYVKMSGNSVLNFRCSENLMDSDLSISPGICEQYGDATLYDRNGLLKQAAFAGRLSEDTSVSFRVIDNVTREKIELGNYKVADWDNVNDEDHFQLSCRDYSYLLESIIVPKAHVTKRTLDELLQSTFDLCNISWAYVDVATQERCQKIVLPKCMYFATNAKTLLNNICTVGVLRVYWYVDSFYVGRCE